MKPLFKRLVTTMALGVTLPLGLPVVAYAAVSTTAGASSPATPGAGQVLDTMSDPKSVTVKIVGSGMTLTSVPSFIGSTSIVNLKKSSPLPVEPDANLTIEDDRGTLTGWTVTATLDELKTSSNHTIQGASLNFSGQDTAANGLKIANIGLPDDGKTSETLLKTTKEINGAGQTAISLKDTTITLPTNGIYAGEYSGHITYTLNNEPQA